MNNRLPMMAKRLDAMMQQELADYCKKMIKVHGKDKAETIKWCADRFDDSGVLAMQNHVTEFNVRDHLTGDLEPFVLVPGIVLSIHHDKFADVIAALVEMDCMNVAGTVASFCLSAEEYGAYVIWKMCYMFPDGEPIDRMRTAYGALFGDKGSELEDGAIKSQATAMPILLAALKAMIAAGALVPVGTMLS